jgi:hypothetical protein
MELHPNQKLTIVTVTDFMHFTAIRHIILTGQQNGQWIYKPVSNHRRRYFLKLNNETMLFHGHALPFKSETDHNVWNGNGCYNLVAEEPAELKAYLLKEQMNTTFDQWGRIRYQHPGNILKCPEHNVLFTEEEVQSISNLV